MGLRERVSQASRLGARGRARPSDSLGGPGKLPTLVAAQCGVRGAGVARTVRLWRRIGEHIGASEALSSSSGANTLREEIVSGLRAGALGT